MLPSRPETSKSFLTEDELLLIQRRLAATQGQVDAQRKQMNDWRKVLQELRDYKVWLFSILYFTPVMAATSLGYFLPKIVQEIGSYTSIQVSLLSIPPYVFGGLMVYILTRLSDRCEDRGWFIIGASVTSFVGFTILSFTAHVGVRYFGLMLVAAGTYPTVPLVSHLCDRVRASC